jgi:predicted  nucleic acid-binding Zn-ribbon protein
MSKSSNPISSDPWESPSVPLDPELIETSKQLMAKSIPIADSESTLSETSQDKENLLIAQLEQEKQQLFKRNVSLVAEIARLRVENQHLRHQLSELKRHQHPGNWLSRLFQGLSNR